MKKNLFLLVFALTGWLANNAQVTQSYDLQTTTGTYNNVTDGTVVPATGQGEDFSGKVYDGSGTVHTEDFTGNGYQIGFNFKFDNKQMNQFLVSSDGYIFLGKDKVTANLPSNKFFALTSENSKDVIGVTTISKTLGISNTEISYKTIGTAPNRTLIVQYKNLGIATRWGDAVADTVQLQYRLYEATGNIELHFNGWQPDKNVYLGYLMLKAGIKGSLDGDHLLASSYTKSTTSTADASLRWSQTSYPPDGLTYTFTPPEDCQAPSAQPTNLNIKSTSTAVSGTFTKSETADHYLVLLNNSANLTALPENNVFYAAGDTLGDARVLAYTADATFNSGDILNGANTYYIHVIGVNSFCMYGPKYNTTSPLVGSSKTLPGAPMSIAIKSTDMTSIMLTSEGNAAKNDIIVAKTSVRAMNDYGNVIPGGTFGTPNASLSIGDSIDGGGYVIYKGAPSTGILAYGLKDNTVYHFKAWSVDNNGQLSSTSVTADGITASQVPWKPNFDQMPDYEIPIGWKSNGKWRKESANSLSTVVNKDATNGTVTSIETPDIFLSEGTNRLVYSLLMTEYVNWSNEPYVFNDNDTIEIQLTTSGKKYTTISTITKDNAPKFTDASTSLKYFVPFDDYSGQEVRLRFLFKLYGGPSITLSDIRVEHKGDCDYPLDVAAIDSTIVGHNATITWKPQGEEDAWDIRYKKATDSEWGDPITVRTRPYTLTGLDGITIYNVQVRARCSTTSQSDWSETATFTSGMSVPFEKRFAEDASAPAGWLYKSGVLDTPTILTDGYGWIFQSSYYGKAMTFGYYSTPANEWLITPKFDVGDGSVNYIVNFNLNSQSSSEATDMKVQLVAARDGENFNAADVVLTIPLSDLPEAYNTKTYTAALKGYKGNIRLGIYVSATDGIPMNLSMDSLGVQYSCVNDVSNFTIANATGTSAKVKWTSGADKWFVFSRKQGETSKNYQTVTTPEYEMTGLKPRTTYEVGITKACEPGDTAAVKLFEVTTPGNGCEVPTDIKVVPSKYSAAISWTSEASGFNVEYRKKGDTTWNKETVTATSAVIRDLLDNTEYEYAVQAMCSKAAADTSDYSDVAVFTTVQETCFAPTDITVTPSYNSAAVKWQGESDNYEIAYRKSDATEWLTMKGAQGEATITDLLASTAYKLRMRSICAPGDTSLWSSVVEFTTTAVPDCVTPTNLTVADITASSAQLSWTADASNLKWNLRYRISTATEWTENDDLTTTSYSLTGLSSNTVYIWRVQAACAESRTSSWASQNKFTTSTSDAIDGMAISDLQVFVKGRILNVINPDGGLIKTIQVFNNSGQMIKLFDVNSTENVFVRLNNVGTFIVKVNGNRATKTVHVSIK
jgi:hypothetical protein